jgi:hypothetical protein
LRKIFDQHGIELAHILPKKVEKSIVVLLLLLLFVNRAMKRQPIKRELCGRLSELFYGLLISPNLFYFLFDDSLFFFV